MSEAGGVLLTIGGWLGLCAAVSGALYLVFLLTGREPRHDPSDQLISGDSPAIPDDLKVFHARSISKEGQR